MRFELADPPAGFIDDPYPVYAALREHSPVHRFADGGVFLTRYADVVDCYRNPDCSSE